MVNDVVHPVTNKSMKKYTKIIKVPELQEVWIEAMCKELGRLAQGWGGTKATYAIQFMTHAEIGKIPADRLGMYAHIVCAFHPQKEDLNRV